VIAADRDRRRDPVGPLLEHPRRSAVLCDVDGTLAPIAARAELAQVPSATGELLARIAESYGLVACVSGRPAADARRMVGVDSIAYVGNHGLERLAPGSGQVQPAAELGRHEAQVKAFAAEADTAELRQLGVKREDKRAIQAFHWRTASDEAAARLALERVAERAAGSGLVPHWGRKVLEIRPALAIDKGTAVAALLRDSGLSAAVFIGDDTTDLDAFRSLKELQQQGVLEHAARVAVLSREGPAELEREADVTVEGTDGVTGLLKRLAAAA
jgi:trehalose 6-phosphate phosphatase